MARKPARMYTQIRGQSYTRREYMGGVPSIRISQFEMGNPKANYPIRIHLVSEERCHIRDIALEAARISANRYLQKRLGMMNYHIKVRVFPHNILRENKQATGAGADRVSDGMRRAFGKAVGMAARVSPGQEILTISTNKTNFPQAKEAMRKARMKLPTPCRIDVEDRS